MKKLEQGPNRSEYESGVVRNDDEDVEHRPSAISRKRGGFSPIWLVPLAAALLLGYLGYRALTTRGPTITVTFKTADGLRAKQTEVKHKAVPLGTVERVELSESGDYVTAHIAMDARAKSMLTDQARFWVVRPRLQGGGIAALQTGLETLVSGPYIALDPGPPGARHGAPKTDYEGLEQPPAVRSGEPGTTVMLTTTDRGSIGVGSVIMHRQVAVGEVIGIDLDQKTGAVSIRAFVQAPYDHLIVAQTCFWNVSGVDVGMGAGGLHVELGSLRTMLSGGIAFSTPSDNEQGTQVGPEHAFQLYPSEEAAQIALHGPTVPYVAYFHDSMLGLSAGSPVRMFGMQVGNVTDLRLVSDGTPDAIPLAARVSFVLQPERALSTEDSSLLYQDQMRAQVARGLRVVLETSSFVTGEKALSLTYMPAANGGEARSEGEALVLPSNAGGIDSITSSLGAIAARLNAIPYEQIGRSVSHMLQSLDRAVSKPELGQAVERLASTLQEVNALAQETRKNLGPALERLPAIASHMDEAVTNANAAISSVAGDDASFQRDAQRMLTQVSDMARSVRLLADYLERHPEALLRGREQEPKPQ